MKVLFATTNPAKISKYKDALTKNGIELLTLADLDFKLDIDENGKDAIENATIKAKSYFEKTNIPTIGMDNSLFIEGIDLTEQPGTYVRRINGKELTDDEMLEYYTGLVKKYGHDLVAKWVYGMVVYTNKGSYNYTWNYDEFYLTDKVNSKRHPGYPLDSISIDMNIEKYFVDLTEEDKKQNKKKDNIDSIIDFIINSLNN